MTVEREWFAAAEPNRSTAPDYLDLLSFEMVALPVLVVAGAMLAFELLRSRVRPKPLMTRIEREVLEHLEAAAPWCRVHAQVCLGGLLQPSKWLPRGTRARARYAYASKIVDFVLEDRRTGEVVALVELDDRFHHFGRDAERDRLTRRAGYLTIRLPASKYPTRTAVLARVSGALNERNQESASLQAARAMQDLRACPTAGAPKPSRWNSRKGRGA